MGIELKTESHSLQFFPRVLVVSVFRCNLANAELHQCSFVSQNRHWCKETKISMSGRAGGQRETNIKASQDDTNRNADMGRTRKIEQDRQEINREEKVTR